MCEEIINVTDSASTNVTNTISANVTSTVPITSDDKKVRYKIDCYILRTFLLATILLFMITIIFYHYSKHRFKQKKYWRYIEIKIDKNDKLKKIGTKKCTRYSFNDIIKVEGLDFDNILLDKKSYENVLINLVSYKTLIGAKPIRIMFDKVNGFIKDFNETKCFVLFRTEKYNASFNRV